jgi:hypothetical protein
MSERLRLELAAMLDQYDRARRALEARKQAVKAEDALFLERFAELRRDVVRPVFAAVGKMLTERGHQFSIREGEYSSENGGKSTEAEIELRVAPAGMESAAAADDHLRVLSFSTRHYNKTVCVRNGADPRAGELAGAKGAYALAQINTQLVEDEVLKLVASLVRA